MRKTASNLIKAADVSRTNLGADTMIHSSNLSVGCLAVGDEAAEDLFILAAETGINHISVILSPVDFKESFCATIQAQLPT